MKQSEIIKSILYSIILVLSHQNVLAGPKQSSIDIIKALLPNIADTKNQITIEGCAYQKEKWFTALLTQEAFKEKLTFSGTCDLEGTYTVKMNEFFPIDLKVKKHKDVKNISGKLKFSIIFEQKPLLMIYMQDMMIKGSQKIKFNLDYGIYIDPMNKDPLGEHKGGILFIRSIDTMKVYKKIKLDSSILK